MFFSEKIIEHSGVVYNDSIVLTDNQWLNTCITVSADGYYKLIFTYHHYDWDQWVNIKIEYADGTKLCYMTSFPAKNEKADFIAKFCKGENKVTVIHNYGHELYLKGIEVSNGPLTLSTAISPNSDYFFKNEKRDIKILLNNYGKTVAEVLLKDKNIDFSVEKCCFSEVDDPYLSGDSDIRCYLTLNSQDISCLDTGKHYIKIVMSDGEILDFQLAVEKEKKKAPLTLVSFDVGHGNSSLLMLPNGKNILIDSGFAPRSEKIIFSYLEKYGLKVDYYLLTHFHSDHDGMLNEILKKFSIKKPHRDKSAENIKKSFSERAYYLSQFGYLDSTMLCRYDELHKIWDLGGVHITALNSRYSENGQAFTVKNDPDLLYNEHNYENATSVSLLVRFNGFGYYHGADNYAYNQEENLKHFENVGRASELKCQYFYANHHFHCDVSRKFVKFVNPYCVYVPANQAVYARSAYKTDYLSVANDLKTNIKDTLISHESGTVTVNVTSGDEWYIYTEKSI